jgi:hypothetical protein
VDAEQSARTEYNSIRGSENVASWHQIYLYRADVSREPFVQWLFFINSGIVILTSSFLGALFFLYLWEFQSMVALRIEYAKSVKVALE